MVGAEGFLLRVGRIRVSWKNRVTEKGITRARLSGLQLKMAGKKGHLNAFWNKKVKVGVPGTRRCSVMRRKEGIGTELVSELVSELLPVTCGGTKATRTV